MALFSVYWTRFQMFYYYLFNCFWTLVTMIVFSTQNIKTLMTKQTTTTGQDATDIEHIGGKSLEKIFSVVISFYN